MITKLDWPSLISHFDLLFLAQVLTLLLCAGIIGYERKNRKKPFGIRTSILIALGTMLFIKYSLMIFSTADLGPGGDPTRVIGQVVTGIGFLGAGTIMNKEGLVVGLTTAATIWVEAAIGVIVACGYLIDAFIFTLIVFITLKGAAGLKIMFTKRRTRKKKTTITS